MKAIQFDQPGSIRFVDISEPASIQPGEALVRVNTVGICGTDYSGFAGKMPFFSYPRIPGHELGVEILELNSSGSPLRSGDRCSVEPYINCQHCYSCRRGNSNCCENHLTLGVHCDGGLRPRFVVPTRKLHPSKALEFDQLALVETLAIGCHAINRGSPQPGENVLVIGAGPIGLSVIEFARLSGARVFVMDLVEQRLKFVREKLGILDTIVGGTTALEQLRDATNGQLADLVVDATGHNESMSRCLEFATFRGRVVYVGITTKELTFPHAPLLHRRELTLLASRNALPGDFTRIIQLIENGQLNTQPWLTHRSTFDALPSTFSEWMSPSSGVIKAVVELQ